MEVVALATADLTVTDATYATGGVGIKTQLMAGAFDYFRVYAP